MQDKHHVRELHRIDGTVGAAGIVFDDLKYTSAADALERTYSPPLLDDKNHMNQ